MKSSAVVATEDERVTRTQRIAFTLALTIGNHSIHLRDRLLGRIPRHPAQIPGLALTPLTFLSGRNLLDAGYAAPDNRPVRAAVLICHGIGEVVSQWVPIQQLLAARGVASLVFDYSGYGRSTGHPTPEQLEQDAIASFSKLREIAPCPISLLGFSLGTGIVPAILDRVAAHRLVLCASFTGFRAATRCVGIPPFLFPLVPPIWNSEQTLRTAMHRVLLVHSTCDRLFPITMAEELAACCGPRAHLHVVDGIRHNEPFYKPTQAYWNPVAEFLTAPDLDIGPCERS
jgi:uncharacterized protein